MKAIIEVQSTVYYYRLLYLLSLPDHSQYSQRCISQPDCFHHCIQIFSWVSSKLPGLHVISRSVQAFWWNNPQRLRARFLSCSTVGIWGWVALWGCRPVHGRMFSGLLDFCPLDTCQESPPPPVRLCQAQFLYVSPSFPQTFFLSVQLIMSHDLSGLLFLEGSLLELSTPYSTLDWFLRLIALCSSWDSTCLTSWESFPIQTPCFLNSILSSLPLF